jgi:hypothetical protein
MDTEVKGDGSVVPELVQVATDQRDPVQPRSFPAAISHVRNVTERYGSTPTWTREEPSRRRASISS